MENKKESKDKLDINAFEEKWKTFWDKEKLYRFEPKSKKKIFSVDTPPPTLSGRMHIGHAASFAQTDFIVRFMRMKGKNVFYPFGTDDNGLPTERLVERKKGVKSKEMPRNEFVNLCLEFLKEERPEFIQDWKDLGISCDWDLSYSTIDKHSRKISQWSLLDLYKKGRAYRKDAPSMWCPECQTGVAQVEVEDKEMDSTFNDIKFKTGNEDLIISTTRPELLPACVSVFYHPEDERYKEYNGKKAKVPLFDFEVPIMEDKRVDPEKGTGLVMCCTFGDQTDMEWQKAYNFPIKMAIDEKGMMTKIAGEYEGLKIKEARKKIIQKLKDSKLLIKQEPIKHPVNVHERCGTEIEFVKSKQWFVKYLDIKEKMLEWGENLNWFPKFMKYRYNNWVNGLQWDWMISNQRHFGVSFPVWYCKNCGEIIFANENQLPVDPLKDKPPIDKCPSCGGKEFIPEEDVLNTWFTSSMTPQIATKLVDKNTEKKLFPMTLRPQAHDIISFWLFNTVLKSQLHFNKNPWKDVTISGFITLKGEKMSKSKGNTVKPGEVREKYGADAIRFWAASSKLGKDGDYQEQEVLLGKKLVKKLLNASKFVFMNLKDYDRKKPKKLESIDELFLDKLNDLVKNSTKNFERYDYSKVKQDIEYFFWRNFCDNYLEIVKKRIYNEEGDKKKSAQYTLYESLRVILKLLAPIMPFITEEIYQKYFKDYEKEKSIHISSWPEFQKKENKKENPWDKILEIISKVRQEKSKNKKSMNSLIELILDEKSLNLINPVLEDFKSVTNAKRINKGKGFELIFVE